MRAIPTGVQILCAGSREARVRADHRFHFTASYLDGTFTDEPTGRDYLKKLVPESL